MAGINIACTARINIQLGSLAIMCKRQPTNVMYCYHNMFVCLRIAPHWQDRFGKKYIFQFGRLEIEGNHKYAYLLAPPVYLCIWSKRKNGILQFGRLETLQIFVKGLLFILIGRSFVVLCNKKQYHVSRWCGFNSQVSSICKKKARFLIKVCNVKQFIIGCFIQIHLQQRCLGPSWRTWIYVKTDTGKSWRTWLYVKT